MDSFKLRFNTATHVGLVRQNNEDAYKVLEKYHFFALADGLGGKNSGEIASQEAVEELSYLIEQNPSFQTEQNEAKLKKMLEHVIILTNSKIWEMSKKEGHLNGMGTTLTCALFSGNKILFGNVGDSRLYRLRHHQLEQLTHDDSLVYELLHFGLIDEEEAKSFPLKHVITKSIGGLNTVEPFILSSSIEDKDIYLLSSDGLHGSVDDKTIASILQKNTSLENISQDLIQAALLKGGHDNITVILIQTLSL